ncbi:hypothetical protein ABAC460_20035 [Asticcacaulis sp. AC460]|uniref:hypothetical protein n=1 Tax=Asticcacaulis sp. AC460 TaxID=1282360 RepID=UPI0003C3D9C1|nr:hypothetical protein [Asticcacaulis sp. AC460]ESQ87316.1 hypothetical protein ABAC460_20035 [Asticcacaulis sp. AC460]
MQRRFIVAAVLAYLLPAVAQAATVETFPIDDAMSRSIDGCGYQLTLPDDFHENPRQATAFVFVNDGTKGIMKIDGDVVETISSHDGKGIYESPDGRVRIEPDLTIGRELGMELWAVDGRLRVIVDGRRQSVAVKGYMGC